jgi:hypothetical protein
MTYLRSLPTLDCVLHDEYIENAKGITVEDRFIVNGHLGPDGVANNHKSYGSLHAPEVTKLLVKSFG